MATFGYLLKGLIDLKHNLAPQEPADAAAAQQEQLRSLLDKAKDTSFGLYYNFRAILAADDPQQAYRERVPIHDYHQLEERWWQQQQRNPDITWPGIPKYFALSSGTTGKKSKRIPVTDDMLSTNQAVGRAQVECLANFDLPADFYEKEILMLSSSADLNERNGHLEGEISGINVSNMPGYLESYYRPGIEIAQIDDWDERLAAIIAAAPSWDIGAMAGIPSWVQIMLKSIIDHYQLKNIHEIWPNLMVYTTGGVAFEPYRKSLERLFAHPLIYMDTYLASEGFFAFNARPDTSAMRLAVEHNMYYEFIPFDETGFDETGTLLKKPHSLSFSEVEEGKDYALLITTCAGAWRYMIGDTIKFTDLSRQEIVITGRTKYFLNVVGSQLSEEKINAAIKQLCDTTDTTIKEFSVAAIRDEQGDYIHQWVLGIESGQLAEEEAAGQLDTILKSLNKNYKVARSKALKGIRVKVVPVDHIYDWLETSKKKGGQIKNPKVIKEDKMLELLEHLELSPDRGVPDPALLP